MQESNFWIFLIALRKCIYRPRNSIKSNLWRNKHIILLTVLKTFQWFAFGKWSWILPIQNTPGTKMQCIMKWIFKRSLKEKYSNTAACKKLFLWQNLLVILILELIERRWSRCKWKIWKWNYKLKPNTLSKTGVALLYATSLPYFIYFDRNSHRIWIVYTSIRFGSEKFQGMKWRK